MASNRGMSGAKNLGILLMGRIEKDQIRNTLTLAEAKILCTCHEVLWSTWHPRPCLGPLASIFPPSPEPIKIGFETFSNQTYGSTFKPDSAEPSGQHSSAYRNSLSQIQTSNSPFTCSQKSSFADAALSWMRKIRADLFQFCNFHLCRHIMQWIIQFASVD